MYLFVGSGMRRQVPKYRTKAAVPRSMKPLLWDERGGGKAPLEKLILRVLIYGRFEELHQVYSRHPSQSFEMLSRSGIMGASRRKRKRLFVS
jgi:hypothetical protein